MSGVHVARQGLVTKSAISSVTRARGPVDYACSLLVSGNGPNGATSPTRVTDLTGNRTIARALTPQPVNATPYWPDGQWSNYFGGSGNYLTAANSAAFDLGTGDCTIEAWVYIGSLSTVSSFLSTFPASGTISGYSFSVDTAGAISLDTWVSGTEQYVLASDNKLSANAWYHIAYTRSSGTSRLFVNGVSCAFTGSISQAINSGGNTLKIGQQGYAGFVYPFTGYISNLRVVKGTAVYTSNFTPSTTPLTAISGTSLLTCQSNRYKDNSSNNFTITPAGTLSVNQFAPFTPPANPRSYGGSVYQTGTARGAYYATTPLPITTGEFCIEAWCNPENFSSARDFISSRAWQTGNNKGWGTQISNTGKVLLIASQGTWNSFPTIITSTTSLVANAWNHVVIQRDSSNVIKIFINGVQDASTLTYASSLDQFNSSFGTHYFTIGNTYADGQFQTAPFNGNISNVRIGVGAGSAIYSASFTPPASLLTATTGTQLLVRFDDSNFIESSDYNDPIVPMGSITQVPSSPFGASYPGSIYFNGSTDYLTVGSNPNVALGSGDFTVECWVNPLSVATSQNIILDWRTSNSNAPVLYLASNQVIWRVNAATQIQGGTLSASTWTHIAVVRSSGTTKLYVNGVSVGSFVDSNSYIVNSLRVGKAWDANYWGGSLTNIRIVKGSAVYGANFTPSTTPLTAVSGTTLLLLGNNTGISDASSSANSVDVVGAAVLSNTQTKYGGTSMYFDGTTGYVSVANATAVQLTTTLFQVEFWMYPMANGRWITGKGATGGTSGWGLYISSAGNFLSLQVGSNIFSTSHAVVLNQWAHVAFTRDAYNVMRVYVDGVLKYSVTNSTSFTQTEALLIGGARDLSAKFQGYIADYRIIRDGVKNVVDFTAPTAALSTSDQCIRLFTNTAYGVNGNYGAGAAQGLVTRSAAPSVSRLRGSAYINANALVIPSLTTGAQKSGLEFTDLSSNALAITRSGTPRAASMVPYKDAGYWSVAFDGSGDYLSTASTTALGTGDFTIECWAYFIGVSAQQNFIDARTASVTTAPIIYATATGVLNYSSGGTALVSSAANTLAVNTWTHIALSRSGGSSKLFVNGVQVGSTATDATNYAATAFTIGATYNGTNPFTGLISNARVVNGTALYTGAFTPSAAPLTAVSGTLLLTCNSYSFWDQSASNYQVTIAGNVTPSFDNPWVSGGPDLTVGSIGFDGASDYLDVANSTALDLTSGDWTCEGWFWPTAWKTGDTWVFGKDGQSGVTYQQYSVHVNSSRKLVGAVGSGASGAGEQKVIGTTTLQLGCWYHFAFVKSGTTLYLFLNGKLEASATQTFTMTHGSYGLRIGGQNNTTGQDFSGSITGLRVVKGTALYTSAFTPSLSAPTAVSGTSLLVNPEPTTKDLSSKKIPLRQYGGVTQVPFSPFGSAYPGSYYCPAVVTTHGINSPLQNRQLLNFGTQDFTIEVWVYVVYTGSMYGDVFYVTNHLTGATHFRFGDSGFGSKLQCASNDLGTSSVYSTSTTRATAANRWIHCALTRQSGVVRVFLDGVQQNINSGINPSTYPLTSWTDSASLNRGAVSFGGGLGGYIAFPHVVIGQALYTASFTKPTAPPTPVAGTVFYAPASNYGLIDSAYQGTLPSVEITNPSSVIVTNATAPSGQATSFAFDGTRSLIIAENANNNLDLGAGGQAWTFEAFVRFASDGQMAIVGPIPSGIASDWWLARMADGSLGFGRTTTELQTGVLTWDPNTWYHVAVSKDATATRTLRIYRNGVLLTSSDAYYSADYSNQSNGIQLGARRTGTTTSGEYMTGNIASFRITKGTACYVLNTHAVPSAPLGVDSAYPATLTNTVYGEYKLS